MFKKLWKGDPVVLAKILVVLIIIASLYGLVYLHRIASNSKGHCLDCGGLRSGFVPTPFNNPVDGNKTSNGGGWAVIISTIFSTSTKWASVTVAIMSSALTVYKIAGIKQSTADISSVNTTKGQYKWYLYANTTSTAGVKYSKGGANATSFPTNNIDTTYGTIVDLETVQSVWLIVIDMDGSGTVTGGDLILVFQNHSGQTAQEVGGTGWELQLSISGGSIGSAQLA